MMKGYVAYLDIIGFSELVRKLEFLESFEQYSKIIENSINNASIKMKYILFSDNLVINTEKDDLEDLELLCKVLSEINFRLLTEMGLPICGCISVGDFSRAEKNGNVIIVGTPIVDAVRYEEKQDWIGIMLSPSVIEKNPTLIEKTNLWAKRLDEIKVHLPWPLFLQRYGEIPFQDGNVFDGYVIVPRHPGSNHFDLINVDLMLYREKLIELKLSAPDPHAQNKYDGTLDYIHSVLIEFQRML